MVCQMSELEEQLLEEKKNHLDSKLRLGYENNRDNRDIDVTSVQSCMIM